MLTVTVICPYGLFDTADGTVQIAVGSEGLWKRFCEGGWLSPLPPEGASAILHHTTHRAAEMAARQGVRSADLLASGALDVVIPECPDARSEPERFCIRVAAAIRHELASLSAVDPATRLNRRTRRFETLAVSAAMPVVAETA